MRAVLAARDVATERCRTAPLDGAHRFKLAKADMPGMGRAPRRAMIAENIRDFQSWARHGKAGLRDPGLAPFAFGFTPATQQVERAFYR